MAEKTVNTIASSPAKDVNLDIFIALQKTIQDVDAEFPLQYTICLAEIARQPGITLTALSAQTDMPLSTVSRIVGALSKNRQKGKPYGLVETVTPPEERRRKLLYLTGEGEALIKRLINIIEATATPQQATGKKNA